LLVIAGSSRKGGSGKTTICSHLAVTAEAAGAGPVGLIDLDPMQGLAGWFAARQFSTPLLANSPALDDPAVVGELLDVLRAAGCRVALIDTPPSVGPVVLAAVRASDLVLVPVQPSPDDLRAVGRTVEAVRAHRKPLIFVINRVKPRSRLTGEAAIVLSQSGTVASVQIGDRVDYAAAKTNGLTAAEIGCAQAEQEMQQLWAYVVQRAEEIASVAAE